MGKSSETWTGDWKARVLKRISERGFGSVTEFLRSMRNSSYRALADELGPDIAPAQLVALQYDEARSAGQLEEAAKDSLLRYLHRYLPEGWGCGEKPEWYEVSALVDWKSSAIGTGQCSDIESVYDKVIDSIRSLPPPVGWLPKGPEDEVIVKAFAMLPWNSGKSENH